eukprot:Sdes_comp20673_c0_seq2m16080
MGDILVSQNWISRMKSFFQTHSNDLSCCFFVEGLLIGFSESSTFSYCILESYSFPFSPKFNSLDEKFQESFIQDLTENIPTGLRVLGLTLFASDSAQISLPKIVSLCVPFGEFLSNLPRHFDDILLFIFTKSPDETLRSFKFNIQAEILTEIFPKSSSSSSPIYHLVEIDDSIFPLIRTVFPRENMPAENQTNKSNQASLQQHRPTFIDYIPCRIRLNLPLFFDQSSLQLSFQEFCGRFFKFLDLNGGVFSVSLDSKFNSRILNKSSGNFLEILNSLLDEIQPVQDLSFLTELQKTRKSKHQSMASSRKSFQHWIANLAPTLNSFHFSFVNVSYLSKNSSFSSSLDSFLSTSTFSPSFHLLQSDSSPSKPPKIHINLPIDSIVYVNVYHSLEKTIALFHTAINRQISCLLSEILKSLSCFNTLTDVPKHLVVKKPFHYHIFEQCPIYITLFQPASKLISKDDSDFSENEKIFADLINQRTNLHQKLRLPLSRPFFKTTNSIQDSPRSGTFLLCSLCHQPL